MKQSNKLETWGNEATMNLNNILYQNIQASPYFKQLYELKTYHEVIDEIYNHVESLEPFLKGTTASTAFCLLYKLWTLRLTVKQVTGLIEHTDSPHIRALGFLYLRYVCKPASLWEWFEGYLEDEEQVQIQGGPRPVSITIGKMCRQLLTEQKWLGTILPRIPVPIARDIEQKIKERLQPPSLPRRESPSYDLDPRVSLERSMRRNDEGREYRTRTRSRSPDRGSSRTSRYHDHDYDRRRDRDRMRDYEREHRRSESRSRRYRTPSRERRPERDYDRRGSYDDKRLENYDRKRRYEDDRKYEDDRIYDRRRSRSPRS
ncbi:PRP38 family-domain-containing protein [Gigaspora rosea]|uniref:Pre-mRNA-splicing factor 38 n=1 Tax=Gigaspora rosea TaxID=44941 RepID=A0A397TZG2_9GLOM|nr:PRP38 family-domain-containing protein [Gigaspora rosea]